MFQERLNVNFINMPYFHAILKIFLVFLVSLIIDLLRRFTIGKYFDKKIEQYYDKILNFLSLKFQKITKKLKFD